MYDALGLWWKCLFFRRYRDTSTEEHRKYVRKSQLEKKKKNEKVCLARQRLQVPTLHVHLPAKGSCVLEKNLGNFRRCLGHWGVVVKSIFESINYAWSTVILILI